MDNLHVRNNESDVKSFPYHSQLVKTYGEIRRRLRGSPASENPPPAEPAPSPPAVPEQPSLTFLAPIEYEDPRRHQQPTIALILREVATAFQILPTDILSPRRDKDAVRARWVVMYLARTMTTRSMPDIGRRIGDRDHTTVLHALRRFPGRMEENPALKAEVLRLQHVIEEICRCPQPGQWAVDFPVRIGGE